MRPTTTAHLTASPTLTPVQQDALQRVQDLLPFAPFQAFFYHAGTGASTVMRALVERAGGCLIDASDFARLTRGRPPGQFDDLVLAEAERLLRLHPLLVIDDWVSLHSVSERSSNRSSWTRLGLKSLSELAQRTGHRLVITATQLQSWDSWRSRFGSMAVGVTMRAFGPADFAALAANVAGAERVAGVDFKKIHRNASQLNAWQLSNAFTALAPAATITAAEVLAWLDEQGSVSNTRLDEVEPLTPDLLPGHEQILAALETHVIIPLEHRDLAQRLGLRPKRGVLLFGPPGTGKTSVGRVLAHRMKGRFFLIDGTFVTEPNYIFYLKVEAVIAEAIRHAPSVVFIDDADSLFGVESIAGLTRYLLTLLDGLQSQAASQVCVVMTAMDIEPIPAAILRSGRVELWLETELPDAAVRERMLHRWLGDRLPGAAGVRFEPLVERTEGFTPADIRRIVGDAVVLYAADLAASRPAGKAGDYLSRATDDLLVDRELMNARLNGVDALRRPVDLVVGDD